MRVLRYISLVLLIASLAGCVKESVSVEPGVPVDINIKVGAGTRGGTDAGSERERLIERIRVMVFFKESGVLDRQAYAEQAGGFEVIPVMLNVKVWSGNKVFCVVANEPEEMTGALDGVTRFGELENLRITDQNTYNTGSVPLPMVVVKDEEIDRERPLSRPIELSLRRVVGKVEMTIVKDGTNRYDVKLESAQVVNTPTVSMLLEGRVDTGPYLADLAPQTLFATDDITAETPVTMTPLYIYEHYRGKGSAEEAAAGGATALKVRIRTDKGSGFITEEYKIPLIGAYDNGEPVYAVYRNTVANLTLTVFGDGIMVSYNLLEWESDEFDKAPGEDDNSVNYEDWIVPDEDFEIEL